jgi:hypothetical protein
MTSAGLKWWHEICREVRESGNEFGHSRLSLLVRMDPRNRAIHRILNKDILAECRASGDWKTYQARVITPQALAFLRKQWRPTKRPGTEFDRINNQTVGWPAGDSLPSPGNGQHHPIVKRPGEHSQAIIAGS